MRSWRALTGVTAARRGAALAAAVASLSLLAACSSAPSYQDLAKIGHAVPVPSGVTFIHEGDVRKQQFPQDTKEVTLLFANHSMSCDQLLAAWEAALKKAHRGFDPPPAGKLQDQILVHDSHASVAIDFLTPACTQAGVSVAEKP